MGLKHYGRPEDLELVDHPEPKVAPGEVLVRVVAAGINPVGWKLAEGRLDALMETAFPLIPGWDVAGVVERVGPDAGEFAPGDEVFGYIRKDHVQLGAYAELVSAHVRMLARKPDSLTWEQAAGVPLAGLTAYQAVKHAGVEAGETVLVQGASGGPPGPGGPLPWREAPDRSEPPRICSVNSASRTPRGQECRCGGRRRRSWRPSAVHTPV
ncbi:NADP-dependent oxidoreductase [Streptomyces sp. KR55]|uniref:NADP-dependent oxidoreductase n=1 Tax=Streptomyces sp. KR55 TaxID=3457425 RepID=UPI003FD67977